MFTVIEVQTNYDCIDKVDHLESFDTIEEANDFVKLRIEECTRSRKTRIEYIEDFVNRIEVPTLNYQDWKIYLAKFNFGRYVHPKDFKIRLKEVLRKEYIQLEGFDPPKLVYCGDLFIIEIKNARRTNIE